MRPRHHEPHRWSSPIPGPTARTLFHQLVRATSALDRALESFGTDPTALKEAREALEAFELLEQTSTDFVVPKEIRRRLREAAYHLSAEHLELARADLGRAGGEFERRLLGGRA